MDEKQLARRSRLKLTYDGKDISQDLEPYLKSVSWSDNASAKADDLQIALEDRLGLWQGDWLPTKGATLQATIITTAWWRKGNDEEELNIGTFEIDEITSAGPPSVVTIKATSVPNSPSLRGIEKNKSWEKIKLSAIAQDIATNASFELFFDSKEDPLYDRTEQTDQSDLSFLLKLCEDAGLALKIADKQIIIFNEIEYEKADPVMTIKRGDALVISYSITSSTRDVYTACQVKYQNATDKINIDYTYTLKNKTGGKTLLINEQVESVAEAEKMAKNRLRQKNKEEIKMSIKIFGSLALTGGATVMIEGWHAFDSKYFIEKADHVIGSGYTVDLTMRMVLDEYE